MRQTGDNGPVSSPSPLRMGIVGIVVLSLFGALFVRMWALQVIDADRYTEVSQANRVRVVAEDAPRGRILDAGGRVVVDNRTSRVVTVERDVLDGLGAQGAEELLTRLAAELTASGTPTKVSRMQRLVVDPRYDPLQPVPVAIDVADDFEVFLAERAAEFPGVAVKRESVRSYPFGRTAAHVVGYTGRISQEDLDVARQASEQPESVGPDAGVIARTAVDKPYQPDSGVGLTGVERTFEQQLRGVPGKRTIEVDARGVPVRDLEVQPPVPGNDVQLTIDIELQQIAEAELVTQLESARRSTGGGPAPAGSVVIADPRNGDIVAMASYPTFAPADFVNGISADRYEALTGGSPTQNPLPNRALSGLYAPGSTFKPLTVWAALADGLIDTSVTLNDPGFYFIGGCDGPSCRRTNSGSEPLGIVDISRSLTRSSNVFYYWLGDKFYGARTNRGDLLQQRLAELGLGAATGVELPGEPSGVIPGPGWKQQTWEALPADQQAFGDPVWYPGDEASLSIGQGDLLVTPLQMAMAFGVFANGGTLYQPHVVGRVLEPGEQPGTPGDTGWVQPEIIRQLPMEPAWRNAIVDGMTGAAGDPSGTARQAFADWDFSTWPVAAKTGTAEVAGRASTSVFGAFVPAGAPELVAFAILEESGFGGVAAGPMTRRILEKYLVGGSGSQSGVVGD